MRTHRFTSLLILVTLVGGLAFPFQSGFAQTATPQDPSVVRAQALLNEMSPLEKVGQLFLVGFNGTSVDSASQIYNLILNYHIGGVVLQRTNDNFTTAPNTLVNARNLISEIQTLEWQNSQGTIIDPNTNAITAGTYIPLFIGLSQSGGGFPNDQILDGLTSLPDEMAIGATWQPTLARQVGNVAGQELSALGINFLLGPSLDVLVTSGTSGGGALEANSFGGDPFWVGEMGREYISGVHEGSNNRMLVIAKHFPGMGSSDRPSSEEVATVRKSLESLKQIELAPFFEVTSELPGTLGTTDGLLVSHIRYQGFQGNIRATTKPVSFDPQALAQILALTPFPAWRENGGLMVSDDLGSPSVRLFYDPSNLSFSGKVVARDAFLAGNDLLNLGNIISSDASDNYATVVQILDFFTKKYQEDAAFAQRVDQSVTRILAAKFRMYGDFVLFKVLPSSSLKSVGNSQAVTFDVSRQAATLISPDVMNLDTLLPTPPRLSDRILFLTDVRMQKQCSDCQEEPSPSLDSLSGAILRLYGPQAGGQVTKTMFSNFSFEDLGGILQGGAGNPDLENQLRWADWVVISMLDPASDQSRVELLRRFFFERQDILREKKVVLFAFDAPYYLDATDISKLTAYYGLYSKSSPFIEVAARLLFQELPPVGSLPVSVAGIGYDLLTVTSPDPNQVIDLSLDQPGITATESVQPADTTPQATQTPYFKVGDTISIKTGIILDHNGRPVPDGTNVRFTLTSSVAGNIIQVMDANTIAGVARTSFGIKQAGLVEVRASIEPSVTSVVMQLDITNEGFSVTVVPPFELTAELTEQPTLAPSPTPVVAGAENGGYPGMSTWLILMIINLALCWLAFFLGSRYYSSRWAFRWVLCMLLGGLGTYDILFGSNMGGSLLIKSGLSALIGLVVVFVLVGWGAGYIWMKWSMKQGGYQADHK